MSYDSCVKWILNLGYSGMPHWKKNLLEHVFLECQKSCKLLLTYKTNERKYDEATIFWIKSDISIKLSSFLLSATKSYRSKCNGSKLFKLHVFNVYGYKTHKYDRKKGMI